MVQQVKAEYDFDAQAGSGELNLKTGEILTVIRKGIDGGWMEGQNSKGKIGLFPESYVSFISAPLTSTAPPAVAPPPLPSLNTQFLNNDNIGVSSTVPASAPIISNYSVPPNTNSKYDSWDDPRIPIAPKATEAASSAPTASGPLAQRGNNASTSNFGSGTNVSYPQLNPTSSEYHEDQFFDDDDWSDDEEIAEFSANTNAKGIVGRSRSTGPETASLSGKQQMGTAKMKTINSVTYSLSGIQVSRRYKHFDWLHEQLSNKYLLIPIPPLPEKQVAGRYEDDLIEHRKLILQLWVDKICRHPVLSQSAVWRHFMTCTDERKWKNGKRAAEKDEYVGGNFFHCITVPTQPLDSDAIKTSAHVLHKVGSAHEEHAKKDLEQLINFLYTYKGLFTNIPDISALAKARENERLHHEGRVSAQDAEAVRQRVDVTTYAMMAEISHLNKERDADFRQMFGAFFAQQSAFYIQIGQQMAQLSELFTNGNDA